MLAETRTQDARASGAQVVTHDRHDRASAGAARAAGRVVYACSLPDGTLVLTGWYRPGAIQAFPTQLPRFAARCLVFPHPPGTARRDAPATEIASGGAADDAVGFLAAVADAGPIQRSVVDVGGHPVVVDPDRLEVVDVGSLASLGFAGVGTATRVQAADFVARIQGFGGGPQTALALAGTLRSFHDAVRERPPACSISPDRAQGLLIDAVHRIDERSFYVRGWMRDADAEITGLTAIAPEGARAELTGGLGRFARPDVEQFYGAPPDVQATARPGFLGYFELDAPSHLPEGWVFEMRNGNGALVEATAPAVTDDAAATRATVLADLVHEVPGEETLVRDHAFPALSKIQERAADPGIIASVTQYGTPPPDPDVTVVVPLYQRIDFLEHQLAQWVNDPDLTAADLVYVLDSPELGAVLAAAAPGLHRLYGVPFRTVVLRRNVGFAHANNAGASLARGRMLLLLNSDVVPDRPGWLSTMVSFHDATPHAGAVGPKLVYEDESIQHAGMYFLRPAGSAWWENYHYFKGLHRRFPPANESRVVPAVTGACLLVPLDLWRRIGGLKGAYVQGDYEDSDLCLRLAELGCDNWYLPQAELYHLEGQSYPTHLRRQTSRFNTWLHTYLWNDRIEAAMQREAATSKGDA